MCHRCCRCNRRSQFRGSVRVQVPAGRIPVSVPLPAGQASTPTSRLAARIASRNEQSPSVLSSSVNVLTLIVVLACAGLAAPETAARQRNTRARRPANANLSFTCLPLLSTPGPCAYRTVETLRLSSDTDLQPLLLEIGRGLLRGARPLPTH